MTSGFIYLLAAYVITESFRSDDRQSWIRDGLFALLTGALGYVLASQWTIWVPALLAGLLHFTTARVLTRDDGSARRWIVRQGVMVIGVFVLANVFGLLARTQLHTFVENFDEIIIVGTAILLVLPFGVQFMTKAIRPFSVVQAAEGAGGFANGGKVIGQYERLLILIFVLASAPTAIGFLVASKSVFRFGDLTDASSRKAAEYILIGTLMSFTYALTIAFGAKYLLENIA